MTRPQMGLYRLLGSRSKRASGRAGSAQNALRHGLSVPISAHPTLAAEVDALALSIAGKQAGPEMKEVARAIAEAQLDLDRIEQARYELLSTAIDESGRKGSNLRGAPFNLIFQSAGPGSDKDFQTLMDPTIIDSGPESLALISALKQLSGLDRYQRRALSRRKKAIRRFDQLRLKSYLATRFGA